MEGGKRVYEMGFCNCWELPVGSGVEATRSPGYGKWLQRERRMVSKGVGARIHRQACVAGGDTVFFYFLFFVGFCGAVTGRKEWCSFWDCTGGWKDGLK